VKSENPKKAVICLSGGMDSTSLLLRLLADGHQVFAISFDYGQKHRLELERLQANIEYLKSKDVAIGWELMDVSGIGRIFHSALLDEDWEVPEGHYETEQMKETVVPNRNAIFASIAFGYALSLANKFDQSVSICLGVHGGDHAIYPDCRPEFYEAIHRAFVMGNWDAQRVSLQLPYLEFDKTQILHDASTAINKLGLDFETIFKNTLTSYSPDVDGTSHGLTGSDVERILAFHRFGVPDPISYQQSWDEVLEQALTVEKEFLDSGCKD